MSKTRDSGAALAGLRVLVVDDEESIRFGVSRILEQDGALVTQASTAAAALAAVEKQQPEIVLLDLKLPDSEGLSALRSILAVRPEAKVVMMTGFGSIENAIGAIRAGAEDFLTKPVDPEHLKHVLKRLADIERLAADNLARRREEDSAEQYWGESEAVRRLLAEARRVADSDALAVLTGESGTGKGVLARQIHRWSARRNGPFVNVNCAGLSRDLLESELFGHEKGAFTGAHAQKRGLFELADHGTLFLDEVAEIDLSLQPRLLKAVEEQRFHRVGGVTERAVDVRVIAATNRSLKEEVAAGRFRSDLYFRLNVLELNLPSLSQRRADIVTLADRFLAEFDAKSRRGVHRLDARAERLLTGYAWPGNVRELRNLMERVTILAPPGVVPDDLLARSIGVEIEVGRGSMPTLEEKEREYIEQVLRWTGGNKSAAADVLGITRNTLYAKIKGYGAAEGE
jgi:DNA-binding NtrC family response regulator